MDDQVDRPASAAVTVPVEELAPGNGDRTLCRVPAGLVMGIGFGTDGKKYGRKRNGAKPVCMISG